MIWTIEIARQYLPSTTLVADAELKRYMHEVEACYIRPWLGRDAYWLLEDYSNGDPRPDWLAAIDMAMAELVQALAALNSTRLTRYSAVKKTDPHSYSPNGEDAASEALRRRHIARKEVAEWVRSVRDGSLAVPAELKAVVRVPLGMDSCILGEFRL